MCGVCALRVLVWCGKCWYVLLCGCCGVVVVFVASLQTECFCQQTLRINGHNNQGLNPERESPKNAH